MIPLLQRLSDRANRVTEWMLVPIVAFFTIVLAVSVFSRYVFQLPVVTSIELTRIAFVWACFLGAAAGLKRRSHVRVVAFVNLLPARLQGWVPAFVHGSFLLFALLMVWHGWGLTARMFATTLPTLGISQGWLYLALPVAGALMALHALAALLGREAVEAPAQEWEGGRIVITVIVAAFLVLVALSAPMAIAIGLAVVLGLAVASPFPITIMFQKMIAGTDNFVLVSIPLFVLTGNLMNAGGITDRIFTFVRRCVGFVPGGLAYANVGSSVIFAGMQGSAVADAAALGKMEIKAMRENGYTTDFAAAVTAASSVVGPIIPPSIPLILYGAIAEVSIGRLFAAGFLPGFLLAATLCAMIAVMDRWKHFPRDQRPSLGEVFRSFGHAFFALMTPAVILVGLLGGVFTPTEAGAVAVVYALILSFFVYRTVRVSQLPSILVETMITTAIVLFIIANVSALSWTLAVTQSASALAAAIRGVSDNPLVFLLLVNLLLLFLGSFIEDGAVLILMTPILVPIAASLGIDLVHFGIVMVLNLMIGVALPPVGMSLFVTAHVAGISVERMFRAVLPFIVPMMITLLVVTYWPRLVLFVPSLLFP